jgi:hypothetical protein
VKEENYLSVERSYRTFTRSSILPSSIDAEHVAVEHKGVRHFTGRGVQNMPSDEWIRTFTDGRRVKFSYDEMMDTTFITAQIEGNEVVYSIMLNKAETNLSRKDVEGRFERELSKSGYGGYRV